MYSLNLEEGKFPIILKPNLGQPILINLRDFEDKTGKEKNNVVFEAIIIAIPNQTIEEISNYFHLNIFIQPILNEEGPFLKRRGEKYPLIIHEIKRIEEFEYKNQGILEEDQCILWDIQKSLLKIDDIFGERTSLYKVKFQINKIKSIIEILNSIDRPFLLFDIVHYLPNRNENKINFHAIAIFKKDWSNFKFIHATDLHIARRNDFISKFLKDKAQYKIDQYKNHSRKLEKVDKFILTRDFEYDKEIQENRLEELRYAKYNFNYNLRLLIEFINEQVKKKNLDFVVIGGDLIDYVRIARGNNQYENNFHVFFEILLGMNRGLDKPPYFKKKEFINEKEIIAPIFTLVGNHDYRYAHYSLKAISVRKIFGLTKKDVKGYHDLKTFNLLTFLKSKNKYLKDYFRYFNPNLNYKLRVGKEYDFIFLDTGQDSKADLHDLLKGGPSTKGLKGYQIDLLRAYIQSARNNKIIIIMHTPPLSPNLSPLQLRKFRKEFNLIRKIEWSDFYEHNLINHLGRDGQLDRLLNLKYQTIMYNWPTFLRICTGNDKIINRKVDLIFCGHTHTLKEFRLKEAREPSSISMGLYFTKIPIKVPCEVYSSRYRDVFKTFKDPIELKSWFDANKPFIFQTQAIGPLSFKDKFKPPGFRYITIKNDQITRIKVYSLYLKNLN